MDGLWEAFLVGFASVTAWLAGETGRAFVSGGLGGVARWFGQDRRTIWSFVVAWFGGAICGVYLSPIVMYFAGYTAPDPETVASQNTAAAFVFVTGAVGISLLKIITAGVENRAKKWSDEE